MYKKITLSILFFFSLNVQAGIEEFNNYIDMAGNKKLNMNSRWTSLIRSAEHVEKDGLEQIRKFADNREWYMRNAALVALNKANPEEALKEARRLIKDKALVVRSAAVEIIARNMNEDHKKLLISEVDQGYNYNKKNSLWIRRQILEKIAKVATKDDQTLFVKNLFDNDKKISELCAKTLEKLTGTKLEGKKLVDTWRAHAKEKSWY